MPYTQPPQLHQMQSDVLIENLNTNSLLPKSTVAALNKGLNTGKQNVIQGINELLSTLKTLQASVATTINQQNSVIGDFTTDPTLLIELQKLDVNILSAIVKLNQEIQQLKNQNRFEDFSQDIVVISEMPTTEFVLKYKPCSPIQVFINGLLYKDSNWTYVKADNKIIWNFTEENDGFNIDKDFVVSLIYDFLYSENVVEAPENP
ncbi:hypothetical protein [Anaerospora hongkongensis]|uniref:hypothetical protein n=1 Tax=Anaerospora hongkongensis TaxID=244830 RepID=UPI00289EBACC|nr:hypothetical protein [Anaerospora hongkongensis]